MWKFLDQYPPGEVRPHPLSCMDKKWNSHYFVYKIKIMCETTLELSIKFAQNNILLCYSKAP